MQLRYKIEYAYDYPINSVIIILQSFYFQKEYVCNNIGNLPAALSQAIADFNEAHKFKIEELENEDTIKAAKGQKSRSKEIKQD